MTYEKWRKRLANANRSEFIPIEWIDALLANGEAQFWGGEDGAMVTQVTDWPGGARTLRIIAAAGRKGEILGPLKQAATDWARAQGCTHIMVEGRDGWRRWLPDFAHYQTIIVEDLG